MRKAVLAVGLFLILAGIGIMGQGTEKLYPIAQAFGQATVSRSEHTLIPKTLVSVPPSSSDHISADLRANEEVVGSVDVANSREVAFYIMNEGNFSSWETGQPSQVLYARSRAITFNFSFVPNKDGTYYFVFVNEDTSRRLVVFSLDEIRATIILSPIFQYAAYESLALGIVLAALGAFTGGKKARYKIEVPEEWKCTYCGERNMAKDDFCRKCKRSRV